MGSRGVVEVAGQAFSTAQITPLELLREAGIIATPKPALIRTVPLDVAACIALVESDRWAAKVSVDPESGCWLWTSYRNRKGYGRVSLDGRIVKAHRVSLVAHLGRDITPGWTLEHLCAVKACVYPEHLAEMTSAENSRAATATTFQAVESRRLTCIRGHSLLDPANLVPSAAAKGGRNCLTCQRERSALITQAARSLSLTEQEYGAAYGRSRGAAEAVIAGAPDWWAA